MAETKKEFNINKERVKAFPRRHPILFNMLLIIVAFLVILYATLFAIDSFTGHGIYETVPNVKGKSLKEAIAELQKYGFKWEVTDSAYSDVYKPGAVMEQEPKANSKVKPLRTIYLSVNATNPRMVTVPMIVDMSCRQGKSMLEGLGFKNVKIETVYSPYKDLILDVKSGDKSVKSVTKLPLNVDITIFIGNGMEEVIPDTMAIDDVAEDGIDIIM